MQEWTCVVCLWSILFVALLVAFQDDIRAAGRRLCDTFDTLCALALLWWLDTDEVEEE